MHTQPLDHGVLSSKTYDTSPSLAQCRTVLVGPLEPHGGSRHHQSHPPQGSLAPKQHDAAITFTCTEEAHTHDKGAMKGTEVETAFREALISLPEIEFIGK